MIFIVEIFHQKNNQDRSDKLQENNIQFIKNNFVQHVLLTGIVFIFVKCVRV